MEWNRIAMIRTDSMTSENSQLNEINDACLSEQNPQSCTLDALFANDVVFSQKTPKELLSTLQSHISSQDLENEIPSNQISENSPKPLSRIPQLEEPLNQHFDIPLCKTKKRQSLGSEELISGLQLLSPQSIEEIVTAICLAQLDLEKEHVKTAESTHTKYLEFQKAQQKLLQDIREILMKDENVLAYFKTGQAVALAAGLVAGIAAAALSFGLLAPAAGVIATIAGSTASSIFFSVASTIGVIGPAATAGLSGLTLGGHAYMKYQSGEHKAENEKTQHIERYLNERLEDTRNRLSTIAENDGAFKEHWFQLLKRATIMLKLIFRK